MTTFFRGGCFHVHNNDSSQEKTGSSHSDRITLEPDTRTEIEIMA